MRAVLLSPETRMIADADGIAKPEGSIESPAMARVALAAGVGEHGTHDKGSPGTWEANMSPPRKRRLQGEPRSTPGPRRYRSTANGSKEGAMQRYRGTKETK